jgi:hypothetical protein
MRLRMYALLTNSGTYAAPKVLLFGLPLLPEYSVFGILQSYLNEKLNIPLSASLKQMHIPSRFSPLCCEVRTSLNGDSRILGQLSTWQRNKIICTSFLKMKVAWNTSFVC